MASSSRSGIPSRATASSAACETEASRGASKGRESVAIAWRDWSRAGGRIRDSRRPVVASGSEAPGLPGDIRELLRHAVVQLPRHPAPLAVNGHLGELALVGGDLAKRAGEDQRVKREAKEIAGVDPLRVDRVEQEVVEA